VVLAVAYTLLDNWVAVPAPEGSVATVARDED
jgi:hypothetical protein